MKLLRCKLCKGEVDVIGNERAVQKKIKCLKCGYSNAKDTNNSVRKEPEVVIIRKR